jgi:hypothetical protein
MYADIIGACCRIRISRHWLPAPEEALMICLTKEGKLDLTTNRYRRGIGKMKPNGNVRAIKEDAAAVTILVTRQGAATTVAVVTRKERSGLFTEIELSSGEMM